MREWLLEYLCCPKTGESLSLIVKKKKGLEILEGELISKSGNKYPIRKGVPRFTKNTFQKKRSVDSFGYEWNTLDYMSFAKKNWEEDIVKNTFKTTDFFKNKLIVEAGAGSGMHTKWLLESGAKKVIAMELSGTVDDAMKKNLKEYNDRCAIIQADISQPPLKKSFADLVYCFNVIQHTKDPLKTTAKNLYALTKKDFAFNIYMTRGKIYLLLDPHYHLRKITVHLPRKVLLGLCYAFGIFGVIPGIRRIFSLVLLSADAPYNRHKLRILYKEVVNNTYDYYGNHQYQHIYTPKQMKDFFDEWSKKNTITNKEILLTGRAPPGTGVIITKKIQVKKE